MSEMPDVKSVLEKTGVRATEFAKIIGVTPVMVYRWMDGAVAHQLRIDRLNKLIKPLLALADERALPLSDKLRGKKRLETIKSLIVKQLQKTV